MLEFCKSINPNLDNYEADGVSCLSKLPWEVIGVEQLILGVAYADRRLCLVEEGTVRR